MGACCGVLGGDDHRELLCCCYLSCCLGVRCSRQRRDDLDNYWPCGMVVGGDQMFYVFPSSMVEAAQDARGCDGGSGLRARSQKPSRQWQEAERKTTSSLVFRALENQRRRHAPAGVPDNRKPTKTICAMNNIIEKPGLEKLVWITAPRWFPKTRKPANNYMRLKNLERRLSVRTTWRRGCAPAGDSRRRSEPL